MDEILQAEVAAVWLLIFSASGPLPSQARRAAVAEDAASWAQAQYDRALDIVMPMVGEMPRSAEWVLDARTIDPREGESSLRLQMPYAGHTLAWTTELREPLIAQLARLRTDSPSISLEAAISRLRVQRRFVSAEDCSGIGGAARDLLQLKAPLRMPNALVMDATAVQLRLRGQYSDSMEITIADTDPSYPLTSWLRETWKVIRECSVPRRDP